MRNLLVTTLILLSAGVTTSGAAVLPSQKQVLDTMHQVLRVFCFSTKAPMKNMIKYNIVGHPVSGSECRDWLEAEKKHI